MLWNKCIERLTTGLLYGRDAHLTLTMAEDLLGPAKGGKNSAEAKTAVGLDNALTGLSTKVIMSRRKQVAKALTALATSKLQGGLALMTPAVEPNRTCYNCKAEKDLQEFQLRRRPKGNGVYRTKMCMNCITTRRAEKTAKRKAKETASSAPALKKAKKKSNKKK